jgi:hypothetical protein
MAAAAVAWRVKPASNGNELIDGNKRGTRSEESDLPRQKDGSENLKKRKKKKSSSR